MSHQKKTDREVIDIDIETIESLITIDMEQQEAQYINIYKEPSSAMFHYSISTPILLERPSPYPRSQCT